LANDDIRTLLVSGTDIFAGTNGSGVFLTSNNGVSWTSINTGLTNAFVLSLVRCGATLLAGVHGSGVWKRPLLEVTTPVDRPANNLPQQFRLDQNYPNPFNPATTITYTVGRTSRVSLRVFNLVGKEVATLLDETQSAGHHEVVFDATNFPSGMYLYQLHAGQLTGTRRMVILK
jgi:hypothetical protein